MKTLALLITLVSQLTLASSKTSSYYIPLFDKDGMVREGVCDNHVDDDGFAEWDCFLGDPATYHGYGLYLFSGDHAMDFTVVHHSERVPWDVMWADVQPGVSHWYGPKNGVIEVRYKKTPNKEMYRTPFALIIRVDSWIPNMTDIEDLGDGYAEEHLVIIQLDGANSKAVAKIDARQKGANAKARKIADSLLK